MSGSRRRGKVETVSKEKPNTKGGAGAVVRLAVAAVAFIILAAGAWWLWADRQPSPADESAATAAVSPATSVEEDEGGGWPAIGLPGAPVTIVEFSDYGCSNCREFATEVLPWMRRTWIADGFVRLEFRDFAILGDGSVRAAEAAHCAADQGQFWAYHDRLFAPDRVGALDDDALLDVAGELALDSAAFAGCLAEGRHRQRVADSTRSGYEQGFEGTPTFVINGRAVSGFVPLDRWQELFELYEKELAATAVPGS